MSSEAKAEAWTYPLALDAEALAREALILLMEQHEAALSSFLTTLLGDRDKARSCCRRVMLPVAGTPITPACCPHQINFSYPGPGYSLSR